MSSPQKHPSSIFPVSFASRAAVSLALCAPLLLTGCFFDLQRQSELEPGEVRGVAVVEGEPVAFARTHLVGDPTFSVSSTAGEFEHRAATPGTYILKAQQDANNDSWPERGALVAFSLVEQGQAEGLFGTSSPVLSSVDLGNVTLRGTVSIEGEVVDENGSPVENAKVVVARDVRLTTLAGDPLVVAGGVEAQVATSATGAFNLAAVLPGEFYVVAFETTGNRIRTSTPRVVTTNGLESIRFDGTDALQLLESAATEREVIATLNPPPAAGVTVSFEVVPAARGISAINTDLEGAVFNAGEASLGELDVGQYNVIVRTSDNRQSIPQRQLVLPGTAPLRWGTIDLFTNLCAPGDDCDGDGINGVPVNLLAACRAECSEGSATCTLTEGEFDCEDDGDGQIDATEPDCYGVGAGTDCDGDGICDWQDDDPFCRAGDTDCDPTAVEDNCGLARAPDPVDGGVDAGPDAGDGGVTVIEDGGIDVDGGPLDAGPLDAGPPDAGPLDAGPLDAGAPDAGPLDAGALDAGAPDAGAPDAGPVDAGPPDAGPVDPGFAVGLGADSNAFSNIKTAVSIGDRVMVLSENTSVQLGGGAVGCPNAATATNARFALAVYDDTGACVDDHYLYTDNFFADRVDAIELFEHPDGALAVLTYDGTIGISPTQDLAIPNDNGLAFVLYRTGGVVEVLAEYEISQDGQGSGFDAMRAAARPDGTTTLAFRVPSFGTITIANETADSQDSGPDVFLVSFDAAGQYVDRRSVVAGADDGFWDLDAIRAMRGTLVAMSIRTYDDVAFSGTAYEISGGQGVVIADAINPSDPPQAVTFDGIDSLIIGDDPDHAALIAVGVDTSARVLGVTEFGEMYEVPILPDDGGSTGEPIGFITGGNQGTYRFAAGPTGDNGAVAYQTPLGSNAVARVSLDDFSTTVLTGGIGLFDVGEIKITSGPSPLVVMRTGNSVRTIPLADGTLSDPYPVDGSSGLALSADGATAYVSEGRGSAGQSFTVDSLSVADVQAGTATHTELFEVFSAYPPLLDVDETGETLWVLTSTNLYAYDLVGAPTAPVQMYAVDHTLDVDPGDIRPTGMGVSRRDGLIFLSSINFGFNGVATSPLDIWAPSTGFFPFQSVVGRFAEGVTIETASATELYSQDEKLMVFALDEGANIRYRVGAGEGARLRPVHVRAGQDTVEVVGELNASQAEEASIVVVDGVSTVTPFVQDHPSREVHGQAYSMLFGGIESGSPSVQSFTTTNALANGQAVISLENSTGRYVLGQHFGFGNQNAIDVLRLGPHAIDLRIGGQESGWIWRVGDNVSHPSNGDAQVAQRLSFDNTISGAPMFLSTHPLIDERVVVTHADDGTLGGEQGCTFASAAETAVLAAVVDASGRCTRSFAIVGGLDQRTDLEVSEPVVGSDGTIYLPIATSEVLRFQSEGATVAALLTPGAGERTSAVVAIDAFGTPTVLEEISGATVGVGTIALGDNGTLMWTVPFSNEVTVATSAAVLGETGTDHQFAVLSASETSPTFAFLWDSIALSERNPVIVQDVLILPNGDYGLSIGSPAGTGTVYFHAVNESRRVVALFHPTAPNSEEQNYRLDHFIGVASDVSLGHDAFSSDITATGLFDGTLDVADGDQTQSANAPTGTASFLIAIPTFDGLKFVPPASAIARVFSSGQDDVTALAHRNARSGAAIMMGTGTAEWVLSAGARNDEVVNVGAQTAPFAAVIGGSFDRLVLHHQSVTGTAELTPRASAAAFDGGAWMLGETRAGGTLTPSGDGATTLTLNPEDLWLWHVQRTASK